MTRTKGFEKTLSRHWIALALIIGATVTAYVLHGRLTREEQIISAISDNLTAITSLTANMSSTCSENALSFSDGFLYLKGPNKCAIWRGSLKSQVWSNATCFNVCDPIDKTGYGYHWNDSSRIQNRFWAVRVGYADQRTAFDSATRLNEVQLADGTEMVNGVTCCKLESASHRLWVQSDNSARIIRCERDYQDGTLFSRADFTNWVTVESAQVPTLLNLEVFYGPGLSWRTFQHTLTNVQVGVAVSDGLFNIWLPPDSGISED